MVPLCRHGAKQAAYRLGDAALVVASSADTGGTWQEQPKVFNTVVRGFCQIHSSPARGDNCSHGGCSFPAEPWHPPGGSLLPKRRTGILFSPSPYSLSRQGARKSRSQPSVSIPFLCKRGQRQSPAAPCYRQTRRGDRAASRSRRAMWLRCLLPGHRTNLGLAQRTSNKGMARGQSACPSPAGERFPV